jgi:hypothetical protein
MRADKRFAEKLTRIIFRDAEGLEPRVLSDDTVDLTKYGIGLI